VPCCADSAQQGPLGVGSVLEVGGDAAGIDELARLEGLVQQSDGRNKQERIILGAFDVLVIRLLQRGDDSGKDGA
jgi:hypothetical protein